MGVNEVRPWKERAGSQVEGKAHWSQLPSVLIPTPSMGTQALGRPCNSPYLGHLYWAAFSDLTLTPPQPSSPHPRGGGARRQS